MKQNFFCIKINTIKRIAGYPILFYLFILMISHSLNTYWVKSLFPNGTLLILLASIVVFVFFRKKNEMTGNQRLLLYMLLLYGVIALYAFINGAEMELSKVFYLGVSFVLLYKSNLEVRDILYIGLVYGVSSLYMLNRYNSAQINSLGIIATFGIVCIINFVDSIIKERKIVIFSIMAVLTAGMIAATGMRGAIAAVIIVYIFTIIKLMKTNKQKAIALFVIPLVLLLTWQTLSNFLSTYLFVDKWGKGNITTGRTLIWATIATNAGVFGLGPDYISGYAHAHNTFIHFIGRYGYIFIPVLLPVIVGAYINIKKD